MTVRSALITALLGLSGCGYAFGIETFGASIRTVSVAVVDNRTFRQGIEIPLTRRIHEALGVHTNLRPTSADAADARRPRGALTSGD